MEMVADGEMVWKIVLPNSAENGMTLNSLKTWV